MQHGSIGSMYDVEEGVDRCVSLKSDIYRCRDMVDAFCGQVRQIELG